MISGSLIRKLCDIYCIGLYLDGGALHMIVPVGSFAGAESYDADLALDLSARETVEKTAQDSFVKAASMIVNNKNGLSQTAISARI